MDRSDKYRTIKSSSTGIYKDRGSKFIGLTYRVRSVENVNDALEEVKKEYRDARHHCYAYKIGMDNNVYRLNDDGEPSGTAGKPIMGQITSFDLTNILIVVTRYFGGTLLGVGGLINAYRSAARDALENAVIITELIMINYELKFPYSAMNDVMSLIKEENLAQSHQNFDLACSLRIALRESLEDRIAGRLSLIKGLEYRKI